MNIYISSRIEVPFICRTAKITHLLSLIDSGTIVDTPAHCIEHLVVNFKDIENSKDIDAPKLEQIEQIFKWVRKLPKDARLLVHCEAGVCRSTAMAFGIWAYTNKEKSLSTGEEWLRKTRPTANPNILVAQHIDTHLKLNGEFVKSCKRILFKRMKDWFQELGMDETDAHECALAAIE